MIYDFIRKFGIVLAIAIIGMGIVGMSISGDSTESGYWLGALIVGIIWLVSDIIVIKKNKRK